MNEKSFLEDKPLEYRVAEYEVLGNKWFFRKDIEKYLIFSCSSWWCEDGDGITLYIKKSNKKFGGINLACFSGIPASDVSIEQLDFNILWRLMKKNKEYNNIETIGNYTYIQQCLIIADYLCSRFCNKQDISDYK
jgi:hypothetical protein